MGKITFRANEGLIERLEELDESKSEVMRRALREYLGEPAVDPRTGPGSVGPRTGPGTVDPRNEAETIDDRIETRIDEIIADRLADHPAVPPDNSAPNYRTGRIDSQTGRTDPQTGRTDSQTGRTDPQTDRTDPRFGPADRRGSSQDINLTVRLDGDTTGERRSGSTSHSPPRGDRAIDRESETGGPEAESEVDDAEEHDEERECKQCGERLAAGAVYCQNCGQKSSRRVFCECGDELRLDWGFCPTCGRRTPAADVLERP